jgi:hypothetical protein
MGTANREGIFNRTMEALQLLACPASVQIQSLPSFVCVTDELALDFNHWQDTLIGNFGSELTRGQIEILTAINENFSHLSRCGSQYKEEFWTDDALRNSADWTQIRAMASEALSRFGWREAEPPSRASEFVKGVQNPDRKENSTA